MIELLTPNEMQLADRLTIDSGIDGYALMQRAGEAVSQTIVAQWPDTKIVAVLCGTGSNGGDGYITARLLKAAGYQVTCFTAGRSAPQSYSERAQRDYVADEGVIMPLEAFKADEFQLIIDALLGTGLTRNVEGKIAACIDEVNSCNKPVCAIDLPSGVSGKSGQPMGMAVKADLTVTFFRKKPGHVLQPGRALCGVIRLCDIGIEADVIEHIKPILFESWPNLWGALLPDHNPDSNKFRRGHVAVFCGNVWSTGAARLSATGAARSGAGLVTVVAPENSLTVLASHLTSIMIEPLGNDTEKLDTDVLSFFKRRKVKAAVLGPGFGDLERAKQLVYTVLQSKTEDSDLKTLVLDADAITAFKDHPLALFAAIEKSGLQLVITPHEGEFQRLFGNFVKGKDKVEQAREAARLSHSIVIYKGADTVIAAPDGRAVINGNGNVLLATAGSGDVLTGIIASFCAQGMPVFAAACAAVWMHAETAECFEELSPAGMMAEDISQMLLKVWARLREMATPSPSPSPST